MTRRKLSLFDERTQLQKINGADHSILLRSCVRRVIIAYRLCGYQDRPAGLEPARVHSLADAFAAVPDPRSPRGRWHSLVAILLIAACAVSCDADGPTAIWQWVDDADEQVLARLWVRREPWSGRRNPPSERTIRRVLALLDPQAVQDAAGALVADRFAAAGLGSPPPVREREQRRAERQEKSCPRRRPTHRGVGFDGKTLRGARRRDGKRVGLLAAACHDRGAVSAQRAIDTKSNEIRIPQSKIICS